MANKSIKYLLWLRSEQTKTLLEFDTYAEAFMHQKNMQGENRRMILKGKCSFKVKTAVAPIVWGMDKVKFILKMEKVYE